MHYVVDGPIILTRTRKCCHEMRKTTGSRIESSKFKVQDVELCLYVYPNGDVDDESEGYVSVYLWNETPNVIFVEYILKIGENESRSKCAIKPNIGRGRPKLADHSELIIDHDGSLKVVCKIIRLTTAKVAWDSYQALEDKVVKELKRKIIFWKTI